MRLWRVLCVLLACGCGGQDLYVNWGDTGPEPTPGPGNDGALIVQNGETVTLNGCTEILDTFGDGRVEMKAEPGVGRVCAIWQAQDTFAVSGDASPVTAATSEAGTWQFLTVVATEPTQTGYAVEFDRAPAITYATLGGDTATACDVPQYTDVTIEAGGTLNANDWDGGSGGAVIFAASGTVTIDGSIDVSGAGFRGGLARGNGHNGDSIEDMDTSDANGGGKGEGLDGTGWFESGRGNYASGAGGGNSHNAGGGGGGNGGAGGFGGKQWEGSGANLNTRGIGGAAITEAPMDLLSFGGGGGAGEDHHNRPADGGAGGGLVFIVASRIAGNGLILANGQDGQSSDEDGAGGGGAGGSVLLIYDSGDFAGVIQANGGSGGDALMTYQEACGPGGGGGGGRIQIDGSFSGTTEVSPGQPGVTEWANGTIDNNDAEAGQPGVVITP